MDAWACAEHSELPACILAVQCGALYAFVGCVEQVTPGDLKLVPTGHIPVTY